jgi:hypothetical protein
MALRLASGIAVWYTGIGGRGWVACGATGYKDPMQINYRRENHAFLEIATDWQVFLGLCTGTSCAGER